MRSARRGYNLRFVRSIIYWKGRLRQIIYMREIFNSIIISPLDCYVCFSKFNFASHSRPREICSFSERHVDTTTHSQPCYYLEQSSIIWSAPSQRNGEKNASNDKSKHGDALDLEAQSLFPIVNLVIILKRQKFKISRALPKWFNRLLVYICIY